MTEARKLSFQYVMHSQPETLLAFLTRRFRYHTADEWAARIEVAAVTINGQPTNPQHILVSRERIVYIPPLVPEPPVDARFEVLFEDDHILAVSKSSNIPTSPSGKYWYNCLRHVLTRELKLPQLHAVHRLDRETSGVNLFAKTKSAASILGAAFMSGSVEKCYAAILQGTFPAPDVLVRGPLRNDGGTISIKQAVHPAGRTSSTRFRLRAILRQASLVEVYPYSGRTHQIRIHAALIGNPVWGDKLYGVTDEEFLRWVKHPERQKQAGHCLHSKWLVFSHPVKGIRIRIVKSERGMMESWVSGEGGLKV